MEDGTSWKSLHHGREGYPELLVKFTTYDTGYAVSLTDLTNVWEEKLSGAQIARRAEQDGCTITPGDDADQLGILLSKIEAAFCCDEGTSVNLECKHASDNLTVIVSAPLPKPLKPFSWHICLKRASSRELTSVIVSPLMQLAHQQRKEIQVLSEQLHHKDHVISKLLDRMESANIHLDSVFLLPNLRPTKMSHREQFAKHVPGLTTFQSGSGRANINEYPSSADLLSILERVPGGGVGDNFTMWKDEWWRDINNFSQAHIALKTGPTMDLDGEDTEDDDDFQTQELPDHLLQKEASSAPPVSKPANTPTAGQGSELDEDAKTTDDGETFPSPRASPQAVQAARAISPENKAPVQKQPRRARLGALGGARSLKATSDGSREQENGSSSSSASNARPHASMDLNTISATPPPTDRTPAIKVSPVNRRLGAIGGRSGSSQSSSQILPEHSPPDPPSSTQNIRGHSSSTGPSINHQQLELHDPAIPAGRSRLAKHGEDQSSQIRETSEERANKKREELKMALDARAKAPAKKKRRF